MGWGFFAIYHYRTGISWQNILQYKLILNCSTSRSRLPCIMSKSRYKHQEKTYKTAEVKLKLNIYFSLLPSTFTFYDNCFISVFKGTQQKKDI